MAKTPISSKYEANLSRRPIQDDKTGDTVFIQIDAHALIDAHPRHHQALDTQK